VTVPCCDDGKQIDTPRQDRSIAHCAGELCYWYRA
jgi:hypothetical protein